MDNKDKQIKKEKDYKSKVKLLKLWEILSSDSDENNPLSTNELLSRLRDIGLECDRRTLYNDIKVLNLYNYEVMYSLKDHSNHYYVGDRGFDVSELKILMDAVTATNVITAKKTKELHNKIAGLAGSYKAELLKKSQDLINLVKSENENVYYIVNELDNAILQEKKVSFQYFEYNIKGEKVFRRNGERYVVNPVATVFSGDRYYLVGFSDNRNELSHYRIDKMLHINIEEDKAFKPDWLKRINLAEYKKQLFSMYSGETVRAVFEADNSYIDVVFDKFGSKTVLVPQDDTHFRFSADIQVSPVFFGWCLSFGDKLKVISPSNLVDNIKEYLMSIKDLY